MPQIHGLANSSQGQAPRHDKPSSDPHTNAGKWSLAKTSVCRNCQSTGRLQPEIAPHRGCLWRLAHPPPPFSAVYNKPTSFIHMNKINSEFAACYWYLVSIRVPGCLDPSYPVGLFFLPSSLQWGQPKTVQVKTAVERHRRSRSRSHRGFLAPALLFSYFQLPSSTKIFQIGYCVHIYILWSILFLYLGSTKGQAASQ